MAALAEITSTHTAPQMSEGNCTFVSVNLQRCELAAMLCTMTTASQASLTPAVQAMTFLPFLACSGAERVEAWTKELSSSADLKPDANGSDIQKMLAGVASRSQEKKFSYNKFFAIGLFRMLELTGG